MDEKQIKLEGIRLNTNILPNPDMNLAEIDREALVDIRNVTVNTDLPKSERIRDYIRQIKNPYCYRHGNYVVRVSFSEPGISLEERLADYIRAHI